MMKYSYLYIRNWINKPEDISVSEGCKPEIDKFLVGFRVVVSIGLRQKVEKT